MRRAVRRLVEVGVPARAAYGDGSMPPPELTDRVRAWVCTWKGMIAPHVGARQAFLVVICNAREALGDVPVERVLNECRGRLVGFLPRSDRLSAYERDCLWSILGAPPLFIAGPGMITRRVRVVRVRTDAPVVPADRGGIALLRAGVWGHPARNRRLASLARALRDQRRDELVRRFPDVGMALGARTVRRVVVLVSVVDHAIALARMIPAVVVCPRSRPAAGLVAATAFRPRTTRPGP